MDFLDSSHRPLEIWGPQVKSPWELVGITTEENPLVINI